MPLAYHAIFGMYRFWLPNDPRGSGSDYIAVWELLRYGHATKVDTRTSVAAGFAQACDESDYRLHACAILPNHVHLVVGAHPRNIRTIVGHMKSKATRALKSRQLWLADERPIWGDHGWNVFLDAATDVERAIRYVDENPLKEGKRAQHWDFVRPFDLQAASRAAQAPKSPPRRIGGAALASHRAAQARRQRRG